MALKFSEVSGFLKKIVKPAYISAIPTLYMAGLAYHQGYYAALGMSASIIPESVNKTYVEAYFGTIAVTAEVGDAVNAHPWVFAVAFIVISSYLAMVFHDRGIIPERVSPIVDSVGRPYASEFIRSVARGRRQWSSYFESLFVVFSSLGVLFLVILFFVIGSLCVVLPYFHAGKREGLKNLKAGFSGNSVVLLNNGENSHKYNLVECAEGYCVVYSKSSGVVAVRKSSIDRFLPTSPAQKKKKGGAISPSPSTER